LAERDQDGDCLAGARFVRTMYLLDERATNGSHHAIGGCERWKIELVAISLAEELIDRPAQRCEEWAQLLA
jgi:hypothetical protein